MLDSVTLGRLCILEFALRRRLLAICGVPSDALTSNQKFRNGFIARAAKAPGITAEETKNVGRGVFGNLALMKVALNEGLVSPDTYDTYLQMHTFCRHAHNNGNAKTEDSVPNEKLLESWETMLGVRL